MRTAILRQAGLAAVVSAVGLFPTSAAQTTGKTLRVEHGRPVIVVSQRSVLLLEFVKQSRAEAMVPHVEPDIRHCRARYRYQVYDGQSGAVDKGEGMVEEVYQNVSTNAVTRDVRVRDVGCHVRIAAGEFNLSWSEATAGTRSWLYYRADSSIRFIQQPQQLAFASVEREQFRSYLESRNVQEFVAAGKRVQVIGPAVFAEELPTDKPASARIEWGRVHEGVFELKLSNLASNRTYVIERSFELGPGAWNAVHAFHPSSPELEWSDPMDSGVNMVFYRIREDTN